MRQTNRASGGGGKAAAAAAASAGHAWGGCSLLYDTSVHASSWDGRNAAQPPAAHQCWRRARGGRSQSLQLTVQRNNIILIVQVGAKLQLSACMERLHSWRVCRDAGCPIQACERPTAICEQLRIVRALQKAGICCTGSLPARIGKVRAAAGGPAVSMRCCVLFMRL